MSNFISKKQLAILSLIIAITVFVTTSALVFAQSFTEPTPTGTLPSPLTTTDAGQAIEGSFGLGINDTVNIPANTSLFVKGNTLSRDWNSVLANLNVSSNTLSIQNGIVGFGTGTCPAGTRACAVATSANQSGIVVTHDTGTGLFGQTQAGTKAGVYGEGYFGVAGRATQSSSIGVVGSSCSEQAGSPGVCINYGNAGYFLGSGANSVAFEVQNGFISGDGGGLYKVGSLKNFQDPSIKGISYRSFVVNTGTSGTINAAAGLPDTVVGIIAVESDAENGVFAPVGVLGDIQYNETAHTLTYSKISGTGTVYFRIILTYKNNS